MIELGVLKNVSEQTKVLSLRPYVVFSMCGLSTLFFVLMAISVIKTDPSGYVFGQTEGIYLFLSLLLLAMAFSGYQSTEYFRADEDGIYFICTVALPMRLTSERVARQLPWKSVESFRVYIDEGCYGIQLKLRSALTGNFSVFALPTGANQTEETAKSIVANLEEMRNRPTQSDRV